MFTICEIVYDMIKDVLTRFLPIWASGASTSGIASSPPSPPSPSSWQWTKPVMKIK